MVKWFVIGLLFLWILVPLIVMGVFGAWDYDHNADKQEAQRKFDLWKKSRE